MLYIDTCNFVYDDCWVVLNSFVDACFVHSIAIPQTSENTKHSMIQNTLNDCINDSLNEMKGTEY